MATQFMKLGFDDNVIKEEEFYNLKLNGKTVGVNIGLGLNYYRGLHLSCVQNLLVTIDGEEVAPHLMMLALNGKKFPIDRVAYLFEEYWGIKETANLLIFNNGLDDKEHEVEVTLHLRNPYMQFAPGIYGAIDSSCKKRLSLREARTLC